VQPVGNHPKATATPDVQGCENLMRSTLRPRNPTKWARPSGSAGRFSPVNVLVCWRCELAQNRAKALCECLAWLGPAGQGWQVWIGPRSGNWRRLAGSLLRLVFSLPWRPAGGWSYAVTLFRHSDPRCL